MTSPTDKPAEGGPDGPLPAASAQPFAPQVMSAPKPFAPQVMGSPPGAPQAFAPVTMGNPAGVPQTPPSAAPFAPQVMGAPPGAPQPFAPQVMGNPAGVPQTPPSAAPFAPHVMGAPPGAPQPFAPQVMGAAPAPVAQPVLPFSPPAIVAPAMVAPGMVAPGDAGRTTPLPPEPVGSDPGAHGGALPVLPFTASLGAVAAGGPPPAAVVVPSAPPPAATTSEPPLPPAPAMAGVVIAPPAGPVDDLGPAASPWNKANSADLDRTMLPSAMAASSTHEEAPVSQKKAQRAAPVAAGPSRTPWIVVGLLLVVAVGGGVAAYQLRAKRGADGQIAVPSNGSTAPADEATAEPTATATATAAAKPPPVVHPVKPKDDDPYSDLPVTRPKPRPAPKPGAPYSPGGL